MTKIAVSAMTNCESFLADGVLYATKKLAELGYHNLEISQHIQFNEETIPQFLEARNTLGMNYCAMSTGFDGGLKGIQPPSPHPHLKSYSLTENYDEVVDTCKKIGCDILRFASIRGRKFYDMATMTSFMEATQKVCERLAKDGITLCAHNHAEEFVKLEGKTIFDWSLELAPSLCWEVDTLNAQRAGLNPVEFINKLGPKATLLHLQDWRIKPADPNEGQIGRNDIYQFSELGEGLMNIPAIVNAAVAVGTRYIIIEQAAFYGRDPYESLAIDARYLINCGYGDMM